MKIKQKMSKKMQNDLIELMSNYKKCTNALLGIWEDIYDFCEKNRSKFKIIINNDKTLSFKGNEVVEMAWYDENTLISIDELYKLFFDRKKYIYKALLDTRTELKYFLDKVNDFLNEYEKELSEEEENK
jgi:hypothetical protein